MCYLKYLFLSIEILVFINTNVPDLPQRKNQSSLVQAQISQLALMGEKKITPVRWERRTHCFKGSIKPTPLGTTQVRNP